MLDRSEPPLPDETTPGADERAIAEYVAALAALPVTYATPHHSD